jgi:hypothetical protein
LSAAIEDPRPSDRLDHIREILKRGKQVRHVIHRHGMSEECAFEVEAALIDYIETTRLHNLVRGQHSATLGPMTVEHAAALYGATDTTVTEPCMLVLINRLYRRVMTDAELYDATRGDWVVGGSRREKAKYAFSVSNGIVREVYQIGSWEQIPEKHGRWRFTGAPAPEMSDHKGHSVRHYTAKGARNPIKYLNC